jgi:vWA found in TerF C terminus
VEETIIRDRDYTLIIDKSGSMSTPDRPGGKTRWEAAQESTLALAKTCEQFDPDGITVYLFSSRFRRYENVTSDKVAKIYEENEPMGRSNLAEVLKDALENYFNRKQEGKTKPNGETFLIVTDGEPSDRKAVMRMIVEASRQIDRDEEIGIAIVQVGRDKKANEFLQALDEQLQSAGAKFDIVDTITMDKMEDMTLAEVLLNTITD